MSGYQDSRFNQVTFSRPGQSGSGFHLRVLLYSHDSVGLGHLRRNLAIAGEIVTRFPSADILIVTGSPCATQFKLPANTDLVKIPSISKDQKGRYVTRNFSGSLHSTLKFRSRIILESFRAFAPHLLIVDHQLTGLKGEAMAMLREAKRRGVLSIFGLRDVKDSPEMVRRHWDTDDSRWVLKEVYDQVCIYGMKDVFDARQEYAPFLDAVKKCDFTGYIVPPEKKAGKKRTLGDRKKVLVTLGGGGDGVLRAESYLRALAIKPARWDTQLITGPLMSVEHVQRIRSLVKKLEPICSVKIHRFCRNIPALLRKSDAVVSMAGYNSCVEILQSGVPAVLLPRSFPRKEQLIRATRMAKLGWVNMIPEANPDPYKLLEAVEAALASKRCRHPDIDLNGLNNLGQIIVDLLQTAGVVQTMPASVLPLSRSL